MTQDALKTQLDSTLCSNYLELLAFSSRKMLWRMVTMVLNPLPDVIKKQKQKTTRAFLVAASVWYQKLLVIQIVRDYRKYQYSGN